MKGHIQMRQRKIRRSGKIKTAQKKTKFKKNITFVFCIMVVYINIENEEVTNNYIHRARIDLLFTS